MVHKENKIIAVVGATGNQGGAVARHLMKNGWKVRALTRNPASQKSQDLLALGSNLELVQADLNDLDSLKIALQGVYGVFSVTTFFTEGTKIETQHGKNIAQIAKEMQVQHFIFTSVGSAHLQTGIPHFESKYKVESYIKEIQLPATIVRPVYIMENFIWFPDNRKGLLNGELAMALPANKTLQMLAVDDIGGVVAAIFEDPERFIGKEIDLAGDELRMEQITETFSEKIGTSITYREIPLEQIRQFSEDSARMFQWFSDVGYSADVATVRQIYSKLQTFKQWVNDLSLN